MFAVEDTAIQVCWRGLSEGEHTVTLEGASATGRGSAGAVVVTGLEPDTHYEVEVDGARTNARTLTAPPGRELYRFATVNDVHIGELAFGFRRTIRERGVSEPFPIRCLRAALAEATAWGAQRMLVKGDLTETGRASEFEAVTAELCQLDMPVDVVLGNHDVKRGTVDGAPILRAGGLHVATEATAIDVPGLRIVLAPTARPGDGHGHMKRPEREALVALVADATTPVMVAVHHYPQRFRFLTTWPPGIPGPEARPLLDAIESAQPDGLFVSGHSHRHRSRQHGSLRVVEIGSTKDYPGAWAGYVVHEGGIRQVVRRVAEPSALAWTERTRRTLFGFWGLWSPGTLGGRCWTLDWSEH